MKLLILLVALLLVGCDNRPIDQREYSIHRLTNIPELKDCVYIRLDGMRVIRCPSSSVNVQYETKSGKASHQHYITTIS